MTLYWGSRDPAGLYMGELAAQWAATLPWFKFVPVVSDKSPEDGWDGRTGLVHAAVMADLPDLSAYQVYACGAPPMIDAARSEFASHCGLPEEQFFADAFSYALDAQP